jgi:hypothetical protein
VSGAFQRIARRALAGALLFVVLAGPTPGAVGSCGGDELDREADLDSYCAEREQLVCVRQALRREITSGQRDDCRRAAIAACRNRSWAPRCQPTERQTQACLNALRSLDTLNTPDDELEECQTDALCTAERRDDAAIGGP